MYMFRPFFTGCEWRHRAMTYLTELSPLPSFLPSLSLSLYIYVYTCCMFIPQVQLFKECQADNDFTPSLQAAEFDLSAFEAARTQELLAAARRALDEKQPELRPRTVSLDLLRILASLVIYQGDLGTGRERARANSPLGFLPSRY